LTSKRGRGRPPFQPDDELRAAVLRLKLLDLPSELVAATLGISVKTLRKHFRRELDCAKFELVAGVAAVLYGLAIAGSVTACMFWLRTKGGFCETARSELVGAEGEPLFRAPAGLVLVEEAESAAFLATTGSKSDLLAKA
jgi:hypothetical protein